MLHLHFQILTSSLYEFIYVDKESTSNSSIKTTRTTTPSGEVQITSTVAFNSTGMAGQCVGVPNDVPMDMIVEDAHHVDGLAFVQFPGFDADFHYVHLDKLGFVQQNQTFVKPQKFKPVPLSFKSACTCPKYSDPLDQ